MAVIKLLIADDDDEVRHNLRRVLSTDRELAVVAEARDGQEAVALAEIHAPDVSLLDIRMPVRDGLAAATEMRRRRPGARIVVLTTFGEIDYIRTAVALGLDGFLLKAGDPYELLRGIHTVVAGGACLSGPVASAVLADGRSPARQQRERRQARAALDTLAPREREILRLVARGAPNADIARHLHLSESTVKSYLRSAFGRLAVRNRVEAALLAWRADPDDEQ